MSIIVYGMVFQLNTLKLCVSSCHWTSEKNNSINSAILLIDHKKIIIKIKFHLFKFDFENSFKKFNRSLIGIAKPIVIDLLRLPGIFFFDSSSLKC